MPITDLAATVKDLIRIRDSDKSRLQRIDSHLRGSVYGKDAGVYVPRKANNEYRMLVDQARFNVLGLVVTSVAQNLYVEGYRATTASGRVAEDNSQVWKQVWQPNRMDARQAALFRSAIAFGVSYAIVLPGERSNENGETADVPSITPRSALQLTAVFEDPLNDEWPELAMETVRTRTVDGHKVSRVRVFDDEAVYTVDVRDGDMPVELINVGEHGLGVVPVVPFFDQYDLGGTSAGKVEPLIPLQCQINQTTFSLLMAQQYGAFRQRWATGMEIAEDENGNPREPFNAAVNTLWQNESPDGRFGEFGQTDLSGYLQSRDKQLLHVASIAQVPPQNLVVGAGISNVSAEALVALTAGHMMDIAEHQASFGESIEQMLRLAGLVMGDQQTWDDDSAQVVWRDTTPRSLAQVADALGKLATQLGIPPRALWDRIPGVTDQDLQRWAQMADERDAFASLDRLVNGPGGAAGAEPGSEPAVAAASG